MIPSTLGGGNGPPGVGIRFPSLKNVTKPVGPVRDVSPNTPASTAGMHPYTDYIVGTPDLLFTDGEDFFTLVSSNLGKALQLYIYNTQLDSIRLVTIIPNQDWGGSGNLGCDVGYGLLHRIPSTADSSDATARATSTAPAVAQQHLQNQQPPSQQQQFQQASVGLSEQQQQQAFAQQQLMEQQQQMILQQQQQLQQLQTQQQHLQQQQTTFPPSPSPNPAIPHYVGVPAALPVAAASPSTMPSFAPSSTLPAVTSSPSPTLPVSSTTTTTTTPTTPAPVASSVAQPSSTPTPAAAPSTPVAAAAAPRSGTPSLQDQLAALQRQQQELQAQLVYSPAPGTPTSNAPTSAPGSPYIPPHQ
eukprot:TRINITY_DN305_c0_g1_i2.p1 TRINITY_DN305_c0_g1~~TRINITY_DN305_c0_g1_i2.p1  ORF type:complete len:358 (+),score=89.97 TRINITY_DN305_c0_g1_i2:83-1156(+)